MVKIGGLGFKRNPNHLAPNHQFSCISWSNKKSMRPKTGEERYRWFFHSFRWPSPAASIYDGMRARSGLVPAILCDLNMNISNEFTSCRFVQNIGGTRWFKVTFWSPSWRSLNPLKGSLNHPKKVIKNCQAMIYILQDVQVEDSFVPISEVLTHSFGLCDLLDWYGMGHPGARYDFLTKHWNTSKKNKNCDTHKKGHHLWAQRDFEWWLKNWVICFCSPIPSLAHMYGS